MIQPRSTVQIAPAHGLGEFYGDSLPRCKPTDAAMDCTSVRRFVPAGTTERRCPGCGLAHYSTEIRPCSKCGTRS